VTNNREGKVGFIYTQKSVKRSVFAGNILAYFLDIFFSTMPTVIQLFAICQGENLAGKGV